MPKKPLSSPYVFQRGNLFGFRWTCSRRLAACLGRKELRRTLATGYRSEAIQRAIAVAAKLTALETYLETILDMRTLKENNLHVLLDLYFHSALADSERWRTHSGGFSEKDLDQEIAALEFMKRDTVERLTQFRTDEPPENLREIANAAGFEAPKPGSAMAKALARGILRTDACLIDVEIKRTRGDYSGDPSLGRPHLSTLSGSGAKRLSEVLVTFQDELAPNWGYRTKQDNAAIFRDFIEILGDPPIGAIGRDTLVEYREIALLLPPNRTKKQEYQGKTIQEVVQLPNLKKSATRTINKRFCRVEQFFKWAEDKGYAISGACPKLRIKESKKIRKNAARDIFSLDDLKNIFLSPEYVSPRAGRYPRTPYMFWLPLMGLFTGARIEELAGLRTKDVIEDNGIACIDINRELDESEIANTSDEERQPGEEEPAEKQVKNDASIRVCALHPKLLELGFLDYVAYRRSKGDIRMFPETKVRSKTNRAGTTASRWFGRYLDRRGITTKKKVFHSFRHTFINALKQKKVHLALAQELAGHQGDSVTYGLYGKGLKSQTQFEILQDLNFGIDFSPLKNEWQKLLPEYHKLVPMKKGAKKQKKPPKRRSSH